MKKRKSIIAKVMSFVLMMTMILSLTACGGSSSADAGYKDELHIAFSAQPSTLDAQISSASSVRQITRAVYESLVALNTSYEAVPELAESVDVNDDSTEFVFHLRKDVKFHNGEEMKADDVVASMNRWIEKFGNAKTLVGEARFVKQDDYTVSITMDKPCISFLNAIAGAKQVAAIMPASVIAGADDSGVKEYIGTGPYKFVEWKQDQYILLEKFDSYSPVDKPSDGYSGKKEALTEKVYFDIVSDASTRLSGIQTGEYDIAANLAIDNYSLIESNPELVTDTELSMAMQVILNKQQGLCANEKFRQGIAAALNMDDILLEDIDDDVIVFNDKKNIKNDMKNKKNKKKKVKKLNIYLFIISIILILMIFLTTYLIIFLIIPVIFSGISICGYSLEFEICVISKLLFML